MQPMKPVNTIVCAVRGGKASEPTAERATALARESSARLIFLYVIDADFLGHATVGRPSVTMTQLKHMAEFILLTIRARAEEQGVPADCAVREGKVREQIRAFVIEQSADTVVMGKPTHQAESDLFTHPEQDTFIRELEEEIGAQVILV